MRLSLLLALSSLLGCTTCGPKPPPPCVDADQDGADSCSDCDDADPLRAPGLAEACDQRDNDCNGVLDDGVSCACTPGTSPTPCGAGGACEQSCLPGGVLGACLPPGATTVELTGDPSNCGECGKRCALPAHAAARCGGGACGRGPCEPGFFDLDGPATFGCESTCAGRRCTFPDGGTVDLNNDPLPESGGAFHTFAAGSSLGGAVQTSSQFTNEGVLGQGVPQGEPGQVEASGGSYRHVGGFTPAIK